MKKITVIFPCAGKGTRLGVPFPKELFPIDKGISIIDTYFDLLYNIKEFVRIVVVINPEKTSLVSYLHKYSKDFDIIFKYQTKFERGMIDAIYTCREYFSTVNLLLLPDTHVIYNDLVSEIMRFIATETENVAIWYKSENNLDVLKQLGPVKVVESINTRRIINFEEKPTYTTCNAFWVSLAFKETCSKKMLDILTKIYDKQTVDIDNTPLFNSLAYEVAQAIDLGVWENIRSFLRQDENTIPQNKRKEIK